MRAEYRYDSGTGRRVPHGAFAGAGGLVVGARELRWWPNIARLGTKAALAFRVLFSTARQKRRSSLTGRARNGTLAVAHADAGRRMLQQACVSEALLRRAPLRDSLVVSSDKLNGVSAEGGGRALRGAAGRKEVAAIDHGRGRSGLVWGCRAVQCGAVVVPSQRPVLAERERERGAAGVRAWAWAWACGGSGRGDSLQFEPGKQRTSGGFGAEGLADSRQQTADSRQRPDRSSRRARGCGGCAGGMAGFVGQARPGVAGRAWRWTLQQAWSRGPAASFCGAGPCVSRWGHRHTLFAAVPKPQPSLIRLCTSVNTLASLFCATSTPAVESAAALLLHPARPVCACAALSLPHHRGAIALYQITRPSTPNQLCAGARRRLVVVARARGPPTPQAKRCRAASETARTSNR
ncbi:hypothetical protein K505DRAFT_331556 [Melanomma pulvis-pyrius CBS 109.77]|uniref:Uncharacterized protein n=1 Tax=Melanomma pulvis-pyrius CBS 109.77 TaxID=1314802 RepID=A0A6A6XWE1_9PLEO|nr:hypothetical protein K505DRAFT_331556 [Melanomma pulvis-pyrius CBS 109.77]